MNFFSRAAAAVKAFRGDSPVTMLLTESSGRAGLLGSLQAPLYSTPSLTPSKAYGVSAALRGPIDVTVDDLAAVSFEVYRAAGKKAKQRLREIRSRRYDARAQRLVRNLVMDGDLERVEASPFLDFYDRGVPEVGLHGRASRRTLWLLLLLEGEAYSLLDVQGGLPWREVPVSGKWIQNRGSRRAGEDYIVSVPGTTPARIPAELVLWRKLANPEHPWGAGSSPAGSASLDIGTDLQLARTVLRNIGDRQAMPDVLALIKSGGLAAKGLNESIRQAGQRGGFFGIPADNPATDLELHSLTPASPRDYQANELRELSSQRIRTAVGRMPPERLGVAASNRATLQAADDASARAILGLLELERHFLQDAVVPYFGSDLLVGYVSPVDDDWEFVLSAMKAAPYGALEIDEWRTMAGLPALDGGKGKGRLVPRGFVYVKDVDQVGVGSEPVAPAAFPVAPPPQPPPPADQRAFRALGLGDLMPRRRSIDAAPELLRRASRLAGPLGQFFLSLVRATRGRVGLAEVVAALEAGDLEAILGVLRVEELATGEDGSGGIQSLGEPGGRLYEALVDGGEIGSDAVAADTGERFNFDDSDVRVVGWSRARASELAAWIRESGQAAVEAVREVLASEPAEHVAAVLRDTLGLTPTSAGSVAQRALALFGEGATPDEATRATAQAVGDALDGRAGVFGADQSYQALQEGQRQSWVQAQEADVLPAGALRVRVSQRDALVCPSCESADGQQRRLDEPFELWEDDADGDGLAESGRIIVEWNPGEAHNGCRCGQVVVY